MTDHPERGSGTILSLSIISVIGAVVLVLAALAAGFDAKHRADSAADFAALAGAQVLHDPFAGREPCEAAALVVGNVDIVSCVVNGDRVTVETRTAVAFGFLSTWHMQGVAEAGPS